MKKNVFLTLGIFLIGFSVFSQTTGGTGTASGLNSALTSGGNDLKSIYAGLSNAMNVIAGLVAVFGIFRVYSKYQNGDQDTNKAIGQFGGAFLFFIVAGYVVKAFFGL